MATAFLLIVASLLGWAAAGRTIIPATKAQIEAQMLKGKYTSDTMKKLRGDTGDIEPQQIHLALTNTPTSMNLMFVTMATCNGTAQFWPADGSSAPVWVDTVITTYSAGDFGWSGSIHTTFLTPLLPSKRYTYIVGCNNGTYATWSEPRNFTAAGIPNPNAKVKIAVTADMGTIVPLGWAVAEAITEEHTLSGYPFDMVMIAGDLSYATLDPPHNEVEWTWDAFGIQNEPFTSTAPYMTTAGNHENVPGTFTNASGTFNVTFAAFSARYHMPSEGSNGNQNFWFSYDFENIHWVSVNSEMDYSPGSPQWVWVANDLEQANLRRNITPFIIFVLHRPILSVDASEYTAHVPGAPLSAAFEPLLYQYKVDLVIQGHEHEYERTHAVFNGTVMTYPDANNTYHNPAAPVYVLQGSCGGMQEETYVSPIPGWSAFHMTNVYGYGRMIVTGNASISYMFVDTDGIERDNFQIVKN